MMTKTQYAKSIVERFCNDNGIKQEEVTSWWDYIMTSSCLAVALEFLGMLNESEAAYSSGRAGCERLYVDVDPNGKPVAAILTTRDMLELLPD